MGFQAVFRSLQEIFPQVDSRLLKAVAIEHSKDVDAAVEFILFEVLPSISVPSEASNALYDTKEMGHVSSEVRLREQVVSLEHEGAEVNTSMLSEPKSVACGSAPSDHLPSSAHVMSPLMGEEVAEALLARYVGGLGEQCFLIPRHEVVKEFNASLPSELNPVEHEVSDLNNDAFQFNSHNLDEMVPGGSLSNIHGGNNRDQLLSNAEPEEASLEENSNSALHANAQDLYGFEPKETISVDQTNVLDFSSSILEKYPDLIEYGGVKENDINSFVSECEELSGSSVEPTETVSAAFISDKDISQSVPEKCLVYIDCGAEEHKDVNRAVGEYDEHWSSCLTEKGAEQLANGIEMVDDNILPTTVATRSGHVVNIDLLEDFVMDAKNNKKILVSAVESVINMMKEVELLEEKTKQAKEEASSAGQDILTKVEELKQMLKRANEANDMHAGEVYGEKAILATEARELQSRLLRLSDERSNSFSVIEEIHSSLEARLAAAENEMAAAEQEKLEKEGLAHKALKEQELIMDTIVEESKKLQQEAEENSKLREFLIDRGRTVDTLQGELAVIFEDVMLLKERVDGRLPLSRSLLLTTCSLASSSSSSNHQSISSDRAVRLAELGESPRSINEEHHQMQHESDITNSGEDIFALDNHKVSSLDGWEVLCLESAS